MPPPAARLLKPAPCPTSPRASDDLSLRTPPAAVPHCREGSYAWTFLSAPVLGGRVLLDSRHENVLAAVVADGVEPALRVQTQAEVAVGDHDPLLVVQGAGDHVAVRGLADRCPAAAEHLLALRKRDREVVRECAGRDVLRRRHHERAGLD